MPQLSTSQSYLTTVLKGSTSVPKAPGTPVGGNMVTANSLAKVNFQIQNKWVNILEALGLQSDNSIAGAVRSAASAAQIISGYSFLPQMFTSHVWRGSTGVDLQLQMRFDAWDDPVADVLTPCQTLLEWFLPYRGDGQTLQSFLQGSGLGNIPGSSQLSQIIGSSFVHPPGPTPYEYVTGETKDLFAVQIGQLVTVTGLIPTSIGWDFEERYDVNGNPMCGTMTLGFTTYVTPTRDDVVQWFKMVAGGGMPTITGGSPAAPSAPAATP